MTASGGGGEVVRSSAFSEREFPGLALDVGPAAVVLVSDAPLRIASTAVVNGGCAVARSIINLFVSRHDDCADPEAMIAAHARRAAVPGPWVGLMTAAWTTDARTGVAEVANTRALAIVTVGLSNPWAAGTAAGPVEAPTHPGTINLIVVVDGDPSPAALLNAMTTATEAKTLVLFDAGVRAGDGAATGTSTDAVVIAATGEGARHRHGGPATAFGWCVARATREALVPAVARWQAERR